MIRSCMPKPDINRTHDLRSKGGYIPMRNLGNNFRNSFFPYFTGLWNNLPKNVQCSQLSEFKDYTNRELKPAKFKHFSRGNKLSNTFLTRI